ncbi:MAG: preprotein translocase subunit YajC [Clostridia bacterium]|nr:preprotein translocase subunit YajC [Clostridia bacterium]
MLEFETIAAAAEGTTTAGTTTAETPNAAQQPPGAAQALVSFFPLILIFVLMYVIMIRPQKKKEKALKEKISKMKVGDKVVTIGGIMGKISKIKDDFVILESGNIGTQDEKSFIKMEKSSIRDVQSKIEG